MSDTVPMYRDGWLLELIKKHRPDGSLAQLSKHLEHPHPSNISKSNKGQRRIQDTEMSPIADYLGIDVNQFIKTIEAASETKLLVTSTNSDPKRNVQALVIPPPVTKMKNDNFTAGLKNLPGRVTTLGAKGGMVIGEATQWLTRPLRLDGVADAYALRFSGDHMQPAYHDGDLVYVHPHLPLQVNRGVLILMRDGEALVGLFTRWTRDAIEIDELHPERRTIAISRENIESTHRIIGFIEP